MSRGNGKVEVIREEEETFDLEQQRRDMEATAAAAEAVEIPALSELEQLRAERDSLVDRLARLQAEFENARKRTQREQQEFRDYATTGTLQSLLPVLDSFERAITSPNQEAAEFRSGVELIYRQFSDALARAGLRPLEAKGQRFDPRLYEAIEMETPRKLRISMCSTNCNAAIC